MKTTSMIIAGPEENMSEDDMFTLNDVPFIRYVFFYTFMWFMALVVVNVTVKLFIFILLNNILYS
jgi:hypothetical protein